MGIISNNLNLIVNDLIEKLQKLNDYEFSVAYTDIVCSNDNVTIARKVNELLKTDTSQILANTNEGWKRLAKSVDIIEFRDRFEKLWSVNYDSASTL